MKKLKAVESLDQGLDRLVRALDGREDLLVAVTSDHSTASVSGLIHSGEPVPAAIVGAKVRRDRVSVFDEVSAAAGCLGFLRGRELLLMLLNYADRSSLMGHRVSPEEKLVMPRRYKPFRLAERR